MNDPFDARTTLQLAETTATIYELRALVSAGLTHLDPEMFVRQYATVFEGDERWNRIAVPESQGGRFGWDPKSTYLAEPPFFSDMQLEPAPIGEITGARVLVWLGDSVTTDHISPAGSIGVQSPAGRWLTGRGVEPLAFNTFGSRRGHHEVMMRGTFGNVRIRNRLVEGTEGTWTVHLPSGERTSIYQAAMRYQDEATPLLVIAGKEYGTGSSRDWAAKGTALLGVKAVIAESYERIHRGNLIGMGVLPLQFQDEQTADSLGLTGHETFEVSGISGAQLTAGAIAHVKGFRGTQAPIEFDVLARLDTAIEVDYYRHGGILPYVLRQLVS